MPMISANIPEGLVDLMKGLARNILKEKPENIYLFSAEYFNNLILEDNGKLDKRYDKFSTKVPSGLTDLMKDLAKSVLKEKPENLYLFAREYFNKLVLERNGKLNKGHANESSSVVQKNVQETLELNNHQLLQNDDNITTESDLQSHQRKTRAPRLNSRQSSASLLAIKEEDLQDLNEDKIEKNKKESAASKIRRAYKKYVQQRNERQKNTEEAAAIIIQRTLRKLFVKKLSKVDGNSKNGDLQTQENKTTEGFNQINDKSYEEELTKESTNVEGKLKNDQTFDEDLEVDKNYDCSNNLNKALDVNKSINNHVEDNIAYIRENSVVENDESDIQNDKDNNNIVPKIVDKKLDEIAQDLEEIANISEKLTQIREEEKKKQKLNPNQDDFDENKNENFSFEKKIDTDKNTKDKPDSTNLTVTQIPINETKESVEEIGDIKGELVKSLGILHGHDEDEHENFEHKIENAENKQTKPNSTNLAVIPIKEEFTSKVEEKDLGKSKEIIVGNVEPEFVTSESVIGRESHLKHQFTDDFEIDIDGEENEKARKSSNPESLELNVKTIENMETGDKQNILFAETEVKDKEASEVQEFLKDKNDGVNVTQSSNVGGAKESSKRNDEIQTEPIRPTFGISEINLNNSSTISKQEEIDLSLNNEDKPELPEINEENSNKVAVSEEDLEPKVEGKFEDNVEIKNDTTTTIKDHKIVQIENKSKDMEPILNAVNLIGNEIKVGQIKLNDIEEIVPPKIRERRETTLEPTCIHEEDFSKTILKGNTSPIINGKDSFEQNNGDEIVLKLIPEVNSKEVENNRSTEKQLDNPGDYQIHGSKETKINPLLISNNISQQVMESKSAPPSKIEPFSQENGEEMNNKEYNLRNEIESNQSDRNQIQPCTNGESAPSNIGKNEEKNLELNLVQEEELAKRILQNNTSPVVNGKDSFEQNNGDEIVLKLIPEVNSKEVENNRSTEKQLDNPGDFQIHGIKETKINPLLISNGNISQQVMESESAPPSKIEPFSQENGEEMNNNEYNLRNEIESNQSDRNQIQPSTNGESAPSNMGKNEEKNLELNLVQEEELAKGILQNNTSPVVNGKDSFEQNNGDEIVLKLIPEVNSKEVENNRSTEKQLDNPGDYQIHGSKETKINPLLISNDNTSQEVKESKSAPPSKIEPFSQENGEEMNNKEYNLRNEIESNQSDRNQIQPSTNGESAPSNIGKNEEKKLKLNLEQEEDLARKILQDNTTPVVNEKDSFEQNNRDEMVLEVTPQINAKEVGANRNLEKQFDNPLTEKAGDSQMHAIGETNTKFLLISKDNLSNQILESESTPKNGKETKIKEGHETGSYQSDKNQTKPSASEKSTASNFGKSEEKNLELNLEQEEELATKILQDNTTLKGNGKGTLEQNNRDEIVMKVTPQINVKEVGANRNSEKQFDNPLTEKSGYSQMHAIGETNMEPLSISKDNLSNQGIESESAPKNGQETKIKEYHGIKTNQTHKNETQPSTNEESTPSDFGKNEQNNLELNLIQEEKFSKRILQYNTSSVIKRKDPVVQFTENKIVQPIISRQDSQTKIEENLQPNINNIKEVSNESILNNNVIANDSKIEPRHGNLELGLNPFESLREESTKENEDKKDSDDRLESNVNDKGVSTDVGEKENQKIGLSLAQNDSLAKGKGKENDNPHNEPTELTLFKQDLKFEIEHKSESQETNLGESNSKDPLPKLPKEDTEEMEPDLLQQTEVYIDSIPKTNSNISDSDRNKIEQLALTNEDSVLKTGENLLELQETKALIDPIPKNTSNISDSDRIVQLALRKEDSKLNTGEISLENIISIESKLGNVEPILKDSGISTKPANVDEKDSENELDSAVKDNTYSLDITKKEELNLKSTDNNNLNPIINDKEFIESNVGKHDSKLEIEKKSSETLGKMDINSIEVEINRNESKIAYIEDGDTEKHNIPQSQPYRLDDVHLVDNMNENKQNLQVDQTKQTQIQVHEETFSMLQEEYPNKMENKLDQMTLLGSNTSENNLEMKSNKEEYLKPSLDNFKESSNKKEYIENQFSDSNLIHSESKLEMEKNSLENVKDIETSQIPDDNTILVSKKSSSMLEVIPEVNAKEMGENRSWEKQFANPITEKADDSQMHIIGETNMEPLSISKDNLSNQVKESESTPKNGQETKIKDQDHEIETNQTHKNQTQPNIKEGSTSSNCGKNEENNLKLNLIQEEEFSKRILQDNAGSVINIKDPVVEYTEEKIVQPIVSKQDLQVKIEDNLPENVKENNKEQINLDPMLIQIEHLPTTTSKNNSDAFTNPGEKLAQPNLKERLILLRGNSLQSIKIVNDFINQEKHLQTSLLENPKQSRNGKDNIVLDNREENMESHLHEQDLKPGMQETLSKNATEKITDPIINSEDSITNMELKNEKKELMLKQPLSKLGEDTNEMGATQTASTKGSEEKLETGPVQKDNSNIIINAEELVSQPEKNEIEPITNTKRQEPSTVNEERTDYNNQLESHRNEKDKGNLELLSLQEEQFSKPNLKNNISLVVNGKDSLVHTNKDERLNDSKQDSQRKFGENLSEEVKLNEVSEHPLSVSKNKKNSDVKSAEIHNIHGNPQAFLKEALSITNIINIEDIKETENKISSTTIQIEDSFSSINSSIPSEQEKAKQEFEKISSGIKDEILESISTPDKTVPNLETNGKQISTANDIQFHPNTNIGITNELNIKKEDMPQKEDGSKLENLNPSVFQEVILDPKIAENITEKKDPDFTKKESSLIIEPPSGKNDNEMDESDITKINLTSTALENIHPIHAKESTPQTHENLETVMKTIPIQKELTLMIKESKETEINKDTPVKTNDENFESIGYEISSNEKSKKNVDEISNNITDMKGILPEVDNSGNQIEIMQNYEKSDFDMTPVVEDSRVLKDNGHSTIKEKKSILTKSKTLSSIHFMDDSQNEFENNSNKIASDSDSEKSQNEDSQNNLNSIESPCLKKTLWYVGKYPIITSEALENAKNSQTVSNNSDLAKQLDIPTQQLAVDTVDPKDFALNNNLNDEENKFLEPILDKTTNLNENRSIDLNKDSEDAQKNISNFDTDEINPKLSTTEDSSYTEGFSQLNTDKGETELNDETVLASNSSETEINQDKNIDTNFSSDKLTEINSDNNILEINRQVSKSDKSDGNKSIDFDDIEKIDSVDLLIKSDDSTPHPNSNLVNNGEKSFDKYVKEENMMSEDEAALQIQKVYRGYQTRKNLPTVKENKKLEDRNPAKDKNAIDLENKNENITSGPKIVNDEKITLDNNDPASNNENNISKVLTEDEAALKIQNTYRGYRTGKNLTPSEKGVSSNTPTINDDKNVPKKSNENSEDAKNDNANVSVQPKEPTKNDEEQAVTKIQSTYRGYRVRKNLTPSEKGVSSNTPTINDDNNVPKKSNENNEERNNDNSNVSVQPKEPTKNDEEQAATKIQSSYRGYHVRKNLAPSEKGVSSNIPTINDDSNVLKKSNENNEGANNGNANIFVQPKELTRNYEEQAATKIQSTYRGYRTRKNLPTLEKGVRSNIQTINDDNNLPKKSNENNEERNNDNSNVSVQPKEPTKNDEEQAATKIQSSYRGYHVRKNLAPSEKGVSSNIPTINDDSNVLKKSNENNEGANNGNANIFVQPKEPTRNYEEQAATKIQSTYRGYRTRKNLPTLEKGVRSNIQTINDDNNLPKKSNENNEERNNDNSNVSVQPKEPTKNDEEQAATKIQSSYRVYHVRKNLAPSEKGVSSNIPTINDDSNVLKKSNENNEGANNGNANIFVQPKEPTKNYEEQAATKIQSTYRGYRTRKNLPPSEKVVSSNTPTINDDNNVPTKSDENNEEGTNDNSNVSAPPKESAKNDEEQAATKIQSTYRGYRVRRNLPPSGKGVGSNTPTINDDNNVPKKSNENNEEANNDNANTSVQPKEPTKNDEEQAATKIQSTYRGYRVRKNLPPSEKGVSSNTPTINDDNNVPKKSNENNEEANNDNANTSVQPKEPTKNDEEQAATKIQSTYRGYRVRKNLPPSEKGVSSNTPTINDNNNVPKKSDENNEEGTNDNSNVSVQPKEPTKNDEEQAATKIQSTYRGYRVRKNLPPSEKGVSSNTPTINDDNNVPKKSNENNEEGSNDNSNVTVQPKEPTKNDEEQAATKIQSTYRGYQTRNNLSRAKAAETPEQKTSSESLSNDQQKIVDENDAAVVIQKTFRGYQARQTIKRDLEQNQPEIIVENPSDQESSSPKFIDDTVEKETTVNEIKEKEPLPNASSLDNIEKNVPDKNAEEEQAALEIQKAYRGYRVRRDLPKTKKTIEGETSLNSMDISGHNASNIPEGITKDKENVQETVPNNNENKNLVKVDQNIEEIELLSVSHESEQVINKDGDIVSDLNEHHRGKDDEESAALTIEETDIENQISKIMPMAEQEISNILNNAVSSTTEILQNQENQVEKSTNDKENAAAIQIQSAYRGYQTRKELNTNSEKKLTDVTLGKENSDVFSETEEIEEPPFVQKRYSLTKSELFSAETTSNDDGETVRVHSRSTIHDEFSDIENLDISNYYGEDSLEAMYYSLRKNEIMLDKMHRRASVHKSASNDRERPFSGYNEDLFEPVKSMENLQKSSSTESYDSVVLRQFGRTASDYTILQYESNESRMSTPIQEYPPAENFPSPIDLAMDKNRQFLNTIHNQLEIVGDAEFSDNFDANQPLDSVKDSNIRRHSSSISEADSDYCETAAEKTNAIHDDFNIKTAFEATTSSDTDSTIVSAATKIQAGARGFLTRRRLRRASLGTSSFSEKRASFGNDAIDESLENFVEQEAASKIQKSYRQFQNRKKRRQSAPIIRKQTEDVSFKSKDSDEKILGITEVKLEQKLNSAELSLQNENDDDNYEKKTCTQISTDANGQSVHQIMISKEYSSEDDDKNPIGINFDELNLAARRMTLQRGDAIQRFSTPEEENGANNVDTGKEEYKENIASDAEKKVEVGAKCRLGPRQRTMPVQIDSEFIRVLPKHMRKRIKSANGSRKRRDPLF